MSTNHFTSLETELYTIVRAHLVAIQLNDFPQTLWKVNVGAQLNFAVMSEMHALIINVPARAQELSESIETRALSTRSQSSSGCGSIAKRRLFYRLPRHCETQKLISINAVPPDVCKPLMASSPGQQLVNFPRHSGWKCIQDAGSQCWIQF
jgi:hypothetical protein